MPSLYLRTWNLFIEEEKQLISDRAEYTMVVGHIGSRVRSHAERPSVGFKVVSRLGQRPGEVEAFPDIVVGDAWCQPHRRRASIQMVSTRSAGRCTYGS